MLPERPPVADAFGHTTGNTPVPLVNTGCCTPVPFAPPPPGPPRPPTVRNYNSPSQEVRLCPFSFHPHTPTCTTWGSNALHTSTTHQGGHLVVPTLCCGAAVVSAHHPHTCHTLPREGPFSSSDSPLPPWWSTLLSRRGPLQWARSPIHHAPRTAVEKPSTAAGNTTARKCGFPEETRGKMVSLVCQPTHTPR